MTELPKAGPITDTVLASEMDACLKDISASAQEASAALPTKDKTANPVHGKCIAKARQRSDHFWLALEEAREHHGWSIDQRDEHRTALVARLDQCRKDDGRKIAGLIYDVAIERLREKGRIELH